MGIPVWYKEGSKVICEMDPGVKDFSGYVGERDSAIGSSGTNCFDFLILSASEVVLQGEWQFRCGSFEWFKGIDHFQTLLLIFEARNANLETTPLTV
jgi:hypothetical protein